VGFFRCRWWGVWIALIFIGKGAIMSASEVRPEGQWLMYQYDRARTGRTPAVGRIQTPRLAWQLDVAGVDHFVVVRPAPGGQTAVFAAPTEFAPLSPDALVNWGLAPARRDVAGKGQLVDPPPADGARWGQFLPDVPGLQRLSWTNRWPPDGVSALRLHSFEDGADRPRLVWEALYGKGSECYLPYVVVLDVDQDGQREAAVSKWYGVVIHDLATGAVKYQLDYRPGDEGCRQYGYFGSYVDAEGRAYLVVNGTFAGHFGCVGVRDGALRVLWHHPVDSPYRQGTGARVTISTSTPGCCADFNGDGRGEFVIALYNQDGDERWHTLAYDLETGELVLDLPDQYLRGLADLDGDGHREFLTQVCPARPVGTNGELAVYRWDRLLARPGYGRWALAPVFEYGLDEDADVNALSAPVILQEPGRAGATVFYTQVGLTETVKPFRLEGTGQVTPGWEWSARAPRGTTVEAMAAAGGDHGTTDHETPLGGPQDHGTTEPLPEDHGTTGPWDHPERSLRSGQWSVVSGPPEWSVLLRFRAEGRADVAGRSDGASLERVATARVPGAARNPLVVLDRKGRPQVVLSDPVGGVSGWVLEGGETPVFRRVWRQPGHGMSGSAPGGDVGLCAGDLNGDGITEILAVVEAAEGHARLIGISPEGAIHWSYDIRDTSGWLAIHNHSAVQYWALGHFSDPWRFDVTYTAPRSSLYTSNETCVVTGWGRERRWRRDMVDMRFGNPGEPPEFMVFGGSLVSVADLDGDGLEDLITPWPSYSVVRGHDGRQLYGRWFGFVGTPFALVHDLNGDGRLDVVLPGSLRVFAVAHRDGGRVEELWTTAEGDGTTGPAALGDTDGDGQLEIGLPGFKDGFRCLEAATGKVLWTVPRQDPSPPSNCVACDLNGDGREEFVYGDGPHLLTVGPGENGNGRVVWQLTLPSRIAHIAVADVDGDGSAEVLCGCDDGVVYGVSSRS